MEIYIFHGFCFFVFQILLYSLFSGLKTDTHFGFIPTYPIIPTLIQLKQKYSRNENVIFYQTHPCAELWFYCHFQYSTADFQLFEPD